VVEHNSGETTVLFVDETFRRARHDRRAVGCHDIRLEHLRRSSETLIRIRAGTRQRPATCAVRLPDFARSASKERRPFMRNAPRNTRTRNKMGPGSELAWKVWVFFRCCAQQPWRYFYVHASFCDLLYPALQPSAVQFSPGSLSAVDGSSSRR
jgi:hypothetical protein